jgi:hypothetical protein
LSSARFTARRRLSYRGAVSHKILIFDKKQGAAGITTAAPYVAG